MAITGGFGKTFDLERGTVRAWAMGRDGVKRWMDNGHPCQENDIRCIDCDFITKDEHYNGEDYQWRYFCAISDEREMDSSVFDCHPDWCPLAPNPTHSGACGLEKIVMQHFEQTSEKKFIRVVNANAAVCTSELGSGRYSEYYAEDGVIVARIDHDLDVFEIAVNHA